MTENRVIQATRKIDADDMAKLHGTLASDQSIVAPLVREQQEFDIRIASRRSEIARNQAEIEALNIRHNERIQALNIEHMASVDRLNAINENLEKVLRILEASNNMLFKERMPAPTMQPAIFNKTAMQPAIFNEPPIKDVER